MNSLPTGLDDMKRLTPLSLMALLLASCSFSIDDGTAMEGRAGGIFDYTFDGNLLSVLNTSWLAFQLVGTDFNDQQVARAPVFPDKLTISPCP